MMNEIQIKERISAITGELFETIVLIPFEKKLTVGGSVTPINDWFFVTDVFLAFDDFNDLGKTNLVWMRIDDWQGNTAYLQCNMSGVTGHHTFNPTSCNLLLSALLVGVDSSLGDVSLFVRGYQVEIVP